MGQKQQKILWQFLKKLNTELPYILAVSFLSMYPKDWKAGT